MHGSVIYTWWHAVTSCEFLVMFLKSSITCFIIWYHFTFHYSKMYAIIIALLLYKEIFCVTYPLSGYTTCPPIRNHLFL